MYCIKYLCTNKGEPLRAGGFSKLVAQGQLTFLSCPFRTIGEFRHLRVATRGAAPRPCEPLKRLDRNFPIWVCANIANRQTNTNLFIKPCRCGMCKFCGGSYIFRVCRRIYLVSVAAKTFCDRYFALGLLQYRVQNF